MTPEVDINPEDWEHKFEISILEEQTRALQKSASELEKEEAWRKDYQNQFLEFLEERHNEPTFTGKQIKEYKREFDLLRHRELRPNAIILQPHKEAPYMVWQKGDGLCEDLGISSTAEIRQYEEATEELIRDSIPENTVKAYRGDVQYIGAWLIASKFDPWKEAITTQWVERFIVDHLTGFQSEEAAEVERWLISEKFKAKAGPHKWSTVNRRLGALSNYCKAKEWDNPVRSDKIRFLLKQLAKMHASYDQHTAITRNKLLHLLDNTTDDNTGVRDRALLSFMFASGGRRRVEAEEALIEDLEDLGDCFLFHMRRSKTNKTGKSEPKPVTGLAADYLRAWLIVVDESSGPLFRPVKKSGEVQPKPLKGTFIRRIVKKLAEKAGYDPKDFSTHSLRSGFVSQAAREGCSMPEVKALTGHRTDAMISRYYQQGDVLRSKAGNLI